MGYCRELKLLDRELKMLSREPKQHYRESATSQKNMLQILLVMILKTNKSELKSWLRYWQKILRVIVLSAWMLWKPARMWLRYPNANTGTTCSAWQHGLACHSDTSARYVDR